MSAPTVRSTPELRPGRDIVMLSEAVMDVCHVEPCDGTYAVMLKHNGKVTIRQVEADHPWRLATEQEINAARSNHVRRRLHDGLTMLLDLLQRPDIVPVQPDTALYVNFPVPDRAALDLIATYTGVQVRTNHPDGRPSYQMSVTFPPRAEQDEGYIGAAPFTVEFTCPNPEYHQAKEAL